MTNQLSEHQKKFTEALMLAITAPSKELCNECVLIANQLGSSLSKKDIELSMMGIETALEYMESSND